jgi:hypothetical protein
VKLEGNTDDVRVVGLQPGGHERSEGKGNPHQGGHDHGGQKAVKAQKKKRRLLTLQLEPRRRRRKIKKFGSVPNEH